MRLCRRLIIIILLASASSLAAAESFFLVAVQGDAETPRWLGLVSLDLPQTVRHLPIRRQANMEALAAGRYAIDHFDFTETVAGDGRTVQFRMKPEIEVKEGTVHYAGDIILVDDTIRFVPSWDTVDLVCNHQTDILISHDLQMGAPGVTSRTITDVCDSVNL